MTDFEQHLRDVWKEEIDLRLERQRVLERPKSKGDRRESDGPPLPKLVLVDRCTNHGEVRWFFIGVRADGTREALFNTRMERFARMEVDRYTKLGIPLEVYKPWR